MDFIHRPKKLFEHGVEVDYKTCDHSFWYYELYYLHVHCDSQSVRDENDLDEDEYLYEDDCRREDMLDMGELQGMYPGAPTCCPFHGYLGPGNCFGTDMQGNKTKVRNIMVCHDHERTHKEERVHHPANKSLEVAITPG